MVKLSVVLSKVAIATALPKTPLAQVVAAAGTMRNLAGERAEVPALTRPKHQTVRPEAHRLTIAIDCLVLKLERVQRKHQHRPCTLRYQCHVGSIFESAGPKPPPPRQRDALTLQLSYSCKKMQLSKTEN